MITMLTRFALSYLRRLKQAKLLPLFPMQVHRWCLTQVLSLVRDAVDAGLPVTPIPGACAPITALMGAGLPSDIFTFMGFLPTKEQAKKNILSNLTEGMGTVILFESPNRIEDTINIIAKVQPDSDVVVRSRID